MTGLDRLIDLISTMDKHRLEGAYRRLAELMERAQVIRQQNGDCRSRGAAA